MNNDIEFRDITKNDVDGLFDLLNNLSKESKMFFHPHHFDKKSLQQICTAMKDHYFVLTLNSTIIGYSMLRLFGYMTPSFGVCIRNGYENKGFGRMMLEKTMQKAVELGYKDVILSIHKENIRAINMYSKNGFIITFNNPRTGEIKMKKSL